ncbi:MAG: hypothetical protein KME12_17475 [Trichocoleus desertorum ATA4-8-CV12]|jgi:serine/threonine-protein kinase|nr:hypothetical protein [Trichocoleus desertorum ATA4-8-CV12]
MFKPSLTISASICVTLSTLGVIQPVLARPSTNITAIEIEPMQKSGQEQLTLIVPDRDVSERSNAGLSRYDLHMAKMFEVTFAHCDQLRPHIQRVQWQYVAGNGTRNLDQFSISCQMAQQVVDAYGLTNSEPTPVNYRVTGANTIEYVPTLNLRGDRLTRFQDTVQQFRPAVSSEFRPAMGGDSFPVAIAASTTASSTVVPISSVRFLPAIQGGQARGIFIVPDRNTTRSAYGGDLRLYDVHLAKMFEVANLYCATSDWQSVEWNYFAGNGDINMGRFVMGCNLVRDVVSAYGQGRKEQTLISFGYGNNSAKETHNLPVLNITGDKIPKFINFAKRFQPVGVAQRVDAERR